MFINGINHNIKETYYKTTNFEKLIVKTANLEQIVIQYFK